MPLAAILGPIMLPSLAACVLAAPTLFLNLQWHASNMVADDDSEGAKRLKMRDLQSEDEDEEDRSLSREHSNELIEEDRSLSREHKLESGSPDSAHPYLERVQGVLARMNPHTGQPLDLSED